MHLLCSVCTDLLTLDLSPQLVLPSVQLPERVDVLLVFPCHLCALRHWNGSSAGTKHLDELQLLQQRTLAISARNKEQCGTRF